MGLKFKNKKNEVLILKDSASSITPLIFGALFLGLGGFLSFFGYFSPVLECHRIGAAVNCELTRQGLFPFKTNRIILKDFLGAEVKTHEDSDGDTYSIVLNAANATGVPFANYSSSGYGSKQKLVRQIEGMLNNQKDFSVKYSQKILLGFGIFFTAFAAMILWSGIKSGFREKNILEAHLAQGILKIYPYNSLKKYEDARPLADLLDIRVETAPKYWKAYALYMQQICQLKGLSMPITVNIMLKAAGLLGGVVKEESLKSKEGNGAPQNNNSKILVVKFKDSSEVYTLLTSYGNSYDAVSEFKKYTGLNDA